MYKEIWKDIKGYEGLYQASNLGRIKSLQRKQWNGYNYIDKPELILKPRYNGKGYVCYALFKEGKRKNFKGHYLVLSTFIKNLENKSQINHKDGIKDNNNLNNLEWCTPKENVIHALETGLIKGKKKKYKYNKQEPKKCLEKYRNIAIEKARLKNSTPIYQYSKDNIFIKKWDNIAKAERYYNKRIHSERKISIGYIWVKEKTYE